MTTDLTSIPLFSPAELELRRDRLRQDAARLRRRERQADRAWVVLGFLGLLVAVGVASGVIFSEQSGNLPNGWHSLATGVSLVGLALALASVESGGSLRVVYVCGMVLGATWPTAVLAPGPWPVFLTALSVVALSAWAAALVRRKVEFPRDTAEQELRRLEELDAERHPDSCVDMVALCDAHAEVRALQARIAALGRRPTVGELSAVKGWARTKGVRDRETAAEAAARQACERLAPASSAWSPESDRVLLARSAEVKTAFNGDGSLRGAVDA